MASTRLPVAPLWALGFVTIASFGTWFYGFGVLIEPIVEDTGWAESTLSTAYGLSLLATGLGAAFAGKLLDRRGSRSLFVGAGLLSGPLLIAASFAPGPWVFLVLAVPAGGVTGAAGYYQATQTVMARLVPAQRAKGLTALTLFGAFASPIYLPLVAWMATTLGWRPALRLAAGSVTLAFALAAVLVPDVRADARPAGGLRYAARLAARNRVVRRLFLAGFGSGVSSSLLLLYQVPAMTDAGLALTTASGLAGFRGLAQLGGRLPLPPVVERFGAGRTLEVTYLLIAASAVLLAFSGSLVVAIAFTLVAGVGIGALPAVEGIVATDLVDQDTLGTSLGLFSLVRGLGAAFGPVVGGLLVDATGGRGAALALVLAAGAAAAVVLPPHREARSAADGRDAGTTVDA